MAIPEVVRVAILNDIGQDVYHVGDEAMPHAAVQQLRRRGLTDLVLLTRDRELTRRSFGDNVGTALTWPFPWPPAEREAELARLRAFLSGDSGALEPGHPGRGLVETLRSVDAVLIAGGGNLNSTYGWLLYERAAVVRIAGALGKQVVISGQTLGPELSEADRAELAWLLRGATLVGLRDADSFRLAQQLVPRHRGLRPCLDDASVLPAPLKPMPAQARPFIAATFSSATGGLAREDVVRGYARLLDAAADGLGARVVFLPHMATPGRGDGDEKFHAEIAAVMRQPAELAVIASALETAERTGQAALVVTSRYHPVVFACGAGVPVIAVAPDDYTLVRLRGALENWGVGRAQLRLTEVVDDPIGVVEQVLAAAEGEREHLDAQRDAALVRYSDWWDAVAATLASDKGRRGRLARQWVRTQRHRAAGVRRHWDRFAR